MTAKLRVFATCDIGDSIDLLRKRGYDVEVYPNPEAPPKSLIIEKVKSGIDGLITTLRAKNHPSSGIVDTNPEDVAPGDVQEMHPWNPYRAMKDDEVGDYYLKRKSYRAALARYQDALVWKEKDAVANFRMAQCYEKLDQPDQAIVHYQEYLKILPEGPFAKDAQKALQKLKAQAKNEPPNKTQSKP